MTVDTFLTKRLQELDQRYYGKYRGLVTDNRDPDKRGRLKLRVPAILADQETDWALPCLPFSGMAGAGLFLVPEVDAQVWVEFEAGDLNRPIWTGGFWPKADQVPEEASRDEPTTRLLQTPSGHVLQFDDASGEEQIRLHHASDAELVIDNNGSLTLTDAKGNQLTLDAENREILIEDANGNSVSLTASGTSIEDSNGNQLEMSGSGIRVKGQQVVVEGGQVMLAGQGGEPILKGQSFLTLFATHVHTAPPSGGSTSPPIPQGEASALSTKVMTS